MLTALKLKGHFQQHLYLIGSSCYKVKSKQDHHEIHCKVSEIAFQYYTEIRVHYCNTCVTLKVVPQLTIRSNDKLASVIVPRFYIAGFPFKHGLLNIRCLQEAVSNGFCSCENIQTLKLMLQCIQSERTSPSPTKTLHRLLQDLLMQLRQTITL